MEKMLIQKTGRDIEPGVDFFLPVIGPPDRQKCNKNRSKLQNRVYISFFYQFANHNLQNLCKFLDSRSMYLKGTRILYELRTSKKQNLIRSTCVRILVHIMSHLIRTKIQEKNYGNAATLLFSEEGNFIG